LAEQRRFLNRRYATMERAVEARRYCGLMFWFIRKKLVGSNFFFRADSRVNAGP